MGRSRWFAPFVVLLVLLVGFGIGSGVYVWRLRQAPDSTAIANPTLTRASALYSEPRADSSPVDQLTAGTPLQLIGRTQNSDWLYGSPSDRPALAGWLPIDAVRDAGNLTGLARVDSSAGGIRSTQAGGEPSRPGPRPDLALKSVGSRQDRLSVLVANAGGADFAGTIVVSVNGGPQTRIDVGKPLRPGEALDAVLNTEYVQRRAKIVVLVTSPDVTESGLENNRLEVVVGPDQPINLAIEAATVDPATGRLNVDLRNRGPIPLVGTVTIGVRESPPGNKLVVVSEGNLDVGAGGVQRFQLASPTPIDMTRMTVTIATDAIADSDPADDTFPR